MDNESKLEEEILASFERGEWQPISKVKSEIARYAELASASLVKNKRVNIRISSRDLDDIQAKAAEEAIPYQTLMASVLHKYVTGRLVEPSPGLTPRSSTARQKRRSHECVPQTYAGSDIALCLDALARREDHHSTWLTRLPQKIHHARL